MVQYASDYDLGTDTPGPLAAGANYFYGGRPAQDSSLSQTIDLSQGSPSIDGGAVTFDASAYLGGFQDEDANAQMTVTFLDAGGNTLGGVTLGPVSNDDRVGTTGLWYRRAIGQVPPGARSAVVLLQMFYGTSGYNDCVADNLSLVLNLPAAPQSLLGANLIVNGNAEFPVVTDPTTVTDRIYDVQGWNREGAFTVDSYLEDDADLYQSTNIPPDAGNLYFYGGPSNAQSSATQDIDVSSAASFIDAGIVNYALSAWLGGYDGQNDNATLTVEYQNWNGGVLDSATLGPLMSVDRNGASELLLLTQNGNVPVGTRVIHLSLVMTRTDGSDNDGIADSLSLVLSAPGITPATPLISGIVSDASFTPGGAVTSGSWVAIFGTELAPVGDARKWVEATEINDGVLPTTLDGTSVTVNGKPAVVEYISPSQVNIQPPDDTIVGPVQVVVKTSNGSSYPFTVDYANVAPGLFPAAPPYIVAQHSDNSYVSSVSPAKPGEVVILWGTGFGPASPAVPSGEVFSGSSPLTNQTTVTIGGQNASVDFAGVVGAGLVQINVHIPAGLPDGDAAVVANVAGESTQTSNNMISIHN